MKDRETPIICPVGESHCDFLDELARLRQQNRELAQQVRTDTLTGLFNFRHLIESLEQEMERTHRSAQPTCLIMLDLDHFKSVNDTWGHDTGNAALVQIATSIRGAVRKLDIPCRYGGEEFALILPSTSLLMGVQVAARLRHMIAGRPLAAGGQLIELTASFGVDVFEPGHTEAPEAFVKRADQFLYQAKQAGRNRVCHASAKPLDTSGSVSQEEKDALSGLFDQSEEKGSS